MKEQWQELGRRVGSRLFVVLFNNKYTSISKHSISGRGMSASHAAVWSEHAPLHAGWTSAVHGNVVLKHSLKSI